MNGSDKTDKSMVKKCLGMHFGVLHFHKSGSQSMKEMFLCLTEEIECKPCH